nr:MAG TPA: hypothetical protein [Caudoviricetes sp.]
MKPPNRPATITTSIHSIPSPPSPYASCFFSSSPCYNEHRKEVL